MLRSARSYLRRTGLHNRHMRIDVVDRVVDRVVDGVVDRVDKVGKVVSRREG